MGCAFIFGNIVYQWDGAAAGMVNPLTDGNALIPATATGQLVQQWSFAAARAADAAAVFNHNLVGAAHRIEMSADGASWSAQDALQIYAAADGGCFTQFSAARSYPYWRVNLNQAGGIAVGELFIGTLFVPPRNYNWGMKRVVTLNRVKNLVRGQITQQRLNREFGFELTFARLSLSALAGIERLFTQNDLFVFIPDYGRPNPACYLCHCGDKIESNEDSSGYTAKIQINSVAMPL